MDSPWIFLTSVSSISLEVNSIMREICNIFLDFLDIGLPLIWRNSLSLFGPVKPWSDFPLQLCNLGRKRSGQLSQNVLIVKEKWKLLSVVIVEWEQASESIKNLGHKSEDWNDERMVLILSESQYKFWYFQLWAMLAEQSCFVITEVEAMICSFAKLPSSWKGTWFWAFSSSLSALDSFSEFDSASRMASQTSAWDFSSFSWMSVKSCRLPSAFASALFTQHDWSSHHPKVTIPPPKWYES